MATIKKAALITENEALKAQLAELQAELAHLKQATKGPAPAAASTVEITVENPLFEGLPVYQPHQQVECPVHGRGPTNKAGFCTKCAVARMRPAHCQERRSAPAA